MINRCKTGHLLNSRICISLEFGFSRIATVWTLPNDISFLHNETARVANAFDSMKPIIRFFVKQSSVYLIRFKYDIP